MATVKKAAPAKKTAAKTAANSVTKTAVKTASKTAAPKQSAAKKAEPTHQEIAALAAKYWAERGHHHGQDAQDWLRAERELRGR